jgi:hypothetical protein
VNELLLDVPGGLLAALSIGLSCLISAGLVAGARRFIDKPGDHHNQVLGMLLSAGGIFCAIVVALSVFVVWDHLTTARQAEVDQGASLIALYDDAEPLPPPARAEVRASIRGYTTSVINDEFPLLSRGESSDRTERSLSQMSATVHRHLGDTTAPDQVNAVGRARYQLALASRTSMPWLLWVLLLGACALLLLMAAPLFMENPLYHAAGSAMLGCALGAALFLILAADHPFAGPLQIRPTDLVQNLHAYTVIDGAGSMHA